MRAGICLLSLLFLAFAACNSVERDLFFASVGDDVKDIAYGWDRGIWNYRSEIQQAATKTSGDYFYRPPAHVSQYRIDRAVHGLGGTDIENAEQLAQVVDTLFWVATNDPTPLVRASACAQLGRLLVKMPVPRNDIIPADPASGEKIHALVQDLFSQKQALDKGERIAVGDVVELLKLLRELRPPRIHSAIELVRAFSLPPIARTAKGALLEVREKMVPPMVRDAILVLLRETACGNPMTRTDADPAPLVRATAARVLARSRSAVARLQAAERLADELDPLERNPHVRADLVRYLGAVGGPIGFMACLIRLGDTDPSVRHHAQAALQRMTGARRPKTDAEWNAYRAKRKRWRIPPPPEPKVTKPAPAPDKR